MENRGVEMRLFDRGEKDRGEQEVPDRWLQLCMLENGWNNNGAPGIVALLTGDDAGRGQLPSAVYHEAVGGSHGPSGPPWKNRR